MVRDPGGKSYAALGLALIIGFAAWGQNAAIENWVDIIEVGNAIPLIGTLAAIGLSWLGQSPLKK
jgi:hypothetical protein